MSPNIDTCDVRHTAGGATAALALAVLLLWGADAAAGKLDDVRDATDDGSSADDGGDDDDDDGGGLGEALADEAGEAFADALFDAAASRAQDVRFRAYPYADGGGWVVDTGEEAPRAPGAPVAPQQGAIALTERVSPAPTGALSSASLRLTLDYAYDWGGVHRPTAALALDTAAGLGGRADFTSYLEPREGKPADFLGIGSADLTLRVADSPRVAPYLGIGWRYLADGDAFRNGFNALFAIDVFPVRPLVVSATAEGGNLGDAMYLHFRAALGASLQHLEIFAGYDAVVIRGGGDAIVFHGPVAGIRGWL